MKCNVALSPDERRHQRRCGGQPIIAHDVPSAGNFTTQKTSEGAAYDANERKCVVKMADSKLLKPAEPPKSVKDMPVKLQTPSKAPIVDPVVPEPEPETPPEKVETTEVEPPGPASPVTLENAEPEPAKEPVNVEVTKG